MGRQVSERGARPLPRPSYTPPTPANDNPRKPTPMRPSRTLPLPANDNFRTPLRRGRPPIPVRPPKPLRMPWLGPRILPGLLGPLPALGFFALDAVRWYIDYSFDYARARRKPSPPDTDLTGWRIEYGVWDLDFYKANNAYAPWLPNGNSGEIYTFRSGPHPTTGSVRAPGTGGSTIVKFWEQGAIRGRFWFDTDRTDAGVTARDRSYWHSSWVRDASFGPASWSPAPGRPFQWQIPFQPVRDINQFPNVLRQMPSPRPASDPASNAVENPYFAPFNPAPQPLPPLSHSRQPPGSNVKEKKTLSRAARIGIAGWKLLDTFSELSEIGGAFWDALPEDLRNKSGCEEGGVSIGQYGNEVNLCQINFLVDNWDKIDTAEAFKNIAKNVVEDMTIGQFHAWLAKMYPPGINLQRTAITHFAGRLEAEKYIARRLSELWEFLGI